MRNTLYQLRDIGIGAAIGATAMYLLDPARGNRRRAIAGEKLEHYANEAGDEMGKAQRDLSNRMKGLFARFERLGHDGNAPDTVIEARVKTKLGRAVPHPGTIHVSAANGVVTLSGQILRREVAKAMRTASSVPGVRHVVNAFTVHSSPDGIPALQGWSPESEARFEFFQTHWSPAARVIAVTSGGGLVIAGLARRGVIGTIAAVAGVAFAIRGISNTPWSRLTGIRAGRGAVTFQKEIDIAAPVDEVYDIWSHFENFPLFMESVLQVRTNGNNLSHWVVRGPAGSELSWEALTTKMVPERVIAWKTTPGAPIASAGIVKFQPARLGGTRIGIRLSYAPPAGGAGNMLAAIFDADPREQMNDDLMRFKSLIEDGKTTVRGRQVTLNQVIRRTEATPVGAQATARTSGPLPGAGRPNPGGPRQPQLSPQPPRPPIPPTPPRPPQAGPPPYPRPQHAGQPPLAPHGPHLAPDYGPPYGTPLGPRQPWPPQQGPNQSPYGPVGPRQ